MLHIFLFLFCLITISASEKYNLCVNTNNFQKDCNDTKLKDYVSCVHAEDSVNTIFKLKARQCDVAVFNAEDLLLTSHFIANETSIIAEIRTQERNDDPFDFETVVIIKSNHETGLRGLKGKKMCHLGFISDKWTLRTATEFDRHFISQVVNKEALHNNTNSNIDKFLADLQSSVGPSCYPGKWVQDSTYDNDLKNKYPDLIKLCKSEDNKEYNPLACLTEGEGDFAYYDLHSTRQYFKNPKLNMSNYKLLCPDDTVQGIDLKIKCSWIRRTWPLIVGTKVKKDHIQNDLDIWIQESNWGKNPLRNLFHMTNQNSIYLPTRILPEIVYIKDDTTPAITYDLKGNVKWCVVGDWEYKKCKWLSQACFNIDPFSKIECVNTGSVLDCLRTIHEKKADLINVDTNYGYLAKQIYDLQPILFEKAGEKNSIIAVKNNSAKVQSLNEIHDANICFPEFNGLAWIIVQNLENNQVSIEDTTKREVCAPGANDKFHGGNNETNKYCNMCPNLCNTTDKYFGDKGALQCLQHAKNAQVAVLIKEQTDIKDDLNIICKDTVKNISKLDTDKDCTLLETVKNHIVAREGEAENLNLKNVLLDIKTYFMKNSKTFSTMKIYGNFEDHQDVLFQNSLEDLLPVDTSDPYVQSYMDLYKSIADSGGDGLGTGYIVLIILSVLVIIAMLVFVVYFLVIKNGYQRAQRAAW